MLKGKAKDELLLQTKKGKKINVALLSSAMAGVVSTVIWKKKDLLKAAALLSSRSKGWVKIAQEPETYMTRNTEEDQDKLFAYLGQSSWRLVDQVADGYFWINEQEEIILLTQKKILLDKYGLWIASKSFGLTD